MKLRNGFKAILPSSVRSMLSRWRLGRRSAKLARLSLSDAFDAVYKERMWQQGESLSGVGSEGLWAELYVAFIARFIEERGIKTIADLGCGDFNVGSVLAPHVDSVLAVDISRIIIARNREKYAHLANVRFDVGNLLDYALPPVDLVLVRQVFQHLTNVQIEAALTSIERAAPAMIVVSEEIRREPFFTTANVDMASHGVITRVTSNSGVLLAKPPFSRAARTIGTIDTGIEGPMGNSVLTIQLIERG